MENKLQTVENLLLEDGSSVVGDRLAFEIVNEIVPKQSTCYYYDDSDSLDSSPDQLYTSCKPTLVDRRLLYWKNMIRQRRAMQRRLCAATAKKPDELLLNADCREHKTIERLLDRAEQVEQNTRNSYNIVGVPREANRELLGVVSKRNVVKRKWLESQALGQKIESEFPNIKNVLEFCPVFDELEVIGKGKWVCGECHMESLASISTLNSQSCLSRPPLRWQNQSEPIKLTNTEEKAPLLKLAVAINGTTYQVDRPEYSPILERMFVCNPYEYSYRVIMRIENNGLQTLAFRWKRSEFFAYNNKLFNHDCSAFVFDTEPFQLVSGAFREVPVLFRPKKVGIIKQRWLLMTKPQIFRGFARALTLNMHGRCKPPQEYLEAIEAHLNINVQAARTSWNIHNADKSVLREPHTCPYSRHLSAYEVFNERNVGFHCKGTSDIIELRKFFALVKPPESPLQWNFSVAMLIDLVCVHEDISQRVDLFVELQKLLATLRGRSNEHRIDFGENAQNIAQRNRTRFIYVRGIISNCVEVWEQKIWLLTSQMLRLRAVQGANTERTYRQMFAKTLRESLYIYTYDHLCNVVEDIVSVIESTEHVKT